MQSELDKIYEEEYREKLKERHNEGLLEGLAKGRDETTSTIVQKMKSDGLSIELIAKYTGLSSGEILAI